MAQNQKTSLTSENIFANLSVNLCIADHGNTQSQHDTSFLSVKTWFKGMNGVQVIIRLSLGLGVKGTGG